MVRLIRDNRGNILFTAMVMIVGIMLGMAVYGAFHGAEAVVGETGTLYTDTDNPHNLAAGSGGVEALDEVRICIFCHTSHKSNTDFDLIDPPLWNHSLSSATYNVLTPGTVRNSITNSVYTPISPSNAGVVNMLSSPSAPDGTSRLCLGCHDGTIGIGNVGSESVPIAMNTASACVTSDGRISSSCSAYIGNDLTTKHVVSIPMNDGLMAASNSSCSDAGQTTFLKYPWESPNPDANVILRPTRKLYGGNPGVTRSTGKYSAGYNYGVQCSTCHDPHDWNANSGNVGYKFLVTQTFDDLCNACHAVCL